VLDVRNNGGGNSENGEALLSLFLDEDVKYGRNVFPLGPDSEPEEHDLWIHPAAKTFGSLNLFLLINEGSSSTTDMVIAGLQAYTDAFTIGKPSRAELVGNNLPRELPNGWVLRLGTVNNIMIDDTVVDGDILPVDQDVDNSLERLQAGTDDQLDAALTRVVM
jgi:C-terminal processing protease CtpA/Prc